MASLKSRLDRALLRIHRVLEHERSRDGQAGELIDRWHARWSLRWDQISERLELIETQLDEDADRRTAGPQLALVGVPVDGEELAPMGA
ncbi:MAG TPA: hypothetical protein VML55_06045 [Planctomycetaceae bacterium]|nr:hypothetical protein [Planctomycetaceae bacterium]